MGVPEREDREETEEILDTGMAEKFPKLMSDIKPQIQKGQRTPSRINEEKATLRHIVSNYKKS